MVAAQLQKSGEQEQRAAEQLAAMSLKLQGVGATEECWIRSSFDEIDRKMRGKQSELEQLQNQCKAHEDKIQLALGEAQTLSECENALQWALQVTMGSRARGREIQGSVEKCRSKLQTLKKAKHAADEAEEKARAQKMLEFESKISLKMAELERIHSLTQTAESQRRHEEQQRDQARSTVEKLRTEVESCRAKLEEEAKAELCVICMDAPKTHIFSPCGHQCVCGACAHELQEHHEKEGGGELRCPVCRKGCWGTMQVFK